MAARRERPNPWLRWCALAASGLARAAATAQPSLADARLKAELVADGLGSGIGALSSAFCFVDRATVLAASRVDGRVRRVNLAPGQTATPGPVVVDLDIIANNPADTQSEYGVQGLVLHPQFASNGWVYIRYDKSLSPGADTPETSLTGTETVSSVVERWVWDPAGNGGVGALTFDATIRTSTDNTRYHHGGSPLFMADGTLLIPFGNQRINNGPSINSTQGPSIDYGVIIRVNDDGSIPADNPFVLSGAPAFTRPWFVYGVRNVFGMARDPGTGRVWFTDNGEFTFDELNLAFAGLNSGHIQIDGPVGHPQQTGSIANLVVQPGSAYHDPQFAWFRTIGVTGIASLRGSALGPAWDDLLVVGMFNFGYLWAFRQNSAGDGLLFSHPGLQDGVDDRVSYASNPAGTEAHELLFGAGFGGNFSSTVALQVGPDGLLYVLSAQGKLWRVTRRCWADIATAGNPDPLAGPDGFVTGEDFDAFVIAYFKELRREPGGFLIADLATAGTGASNPDGFVTGEDFDLFIIEFFTGCS